MKYKVTGLIVCALIVTVVMVFSLSCEKNPVAPEATSEEAIGDNISLASNIPPPPITGIYNLGTWNDRLKAIEVAGDSSGKSYVVLYQHINYEGQREVFIANDPNFDGFLDYPGNTIGNDIASSVKLVRGATCTLYEHSRYGGKQLKLTASCPNLKKKYREKLFLWFNKTWNDCASAIKVSNITAKGVVLYDSDYAGEYGTHPGRSWVLFKDCNDLYKKYGIGTSGTGIAISMLKLVNICNVKLHMYYHSPYCTREDLVPINNGEILLQCGNGKLDLIK